MIDWHNFEEVEEIRVQSFLNKAMAGERLSLPARCPHCHFSPNTMHIYLHRHNVKIGGAWVWCSRCRRYVHISIVPPVWWRNIDEVEEESLTSMPEYLDELAFIIDQHWNHLQDMME